MTVWPSPKKVDYRPMSTGSCKKAEPQHAFSAEEPIKTVNLNIGNIKEWHILDSGAISHFLFVDVPFDGISISSDPLTVQHPVCAQVHSSHTCSLWITNSPQKAQLAHVIPGLASHLLLSVVCLCNAGCKVTFTKIECCVKYRGQIILQGYKCLKSGLWMVNLQGCEVSKKPIERPYV